MILRETLCRKLIFTTGFLLILLGVWLGNGSVAHLSQAVSPSNPLYGWGLNDSGQLGNGTVNNANTPVIVNLPQGVSATALSAGSGHSLAIGSNDKLYAWGRNYEGELGNGSTNAGNPTPVMVSLPTGVKPIAVAAGGYYGMAIGSDSKLYTWGYNYYGQLGNGTTAISSLPGVITLADGVKPVAITAGTNHSLAIGSDHKVYAWGFNGAEQLGNGTTTQSNSPIPLNLPTGVIPVAISAGNNDTLVLGNNSKLYVWGNIQFGDNTSNGVDPITVSLSDGVNIVRVEAGSEYVLLIGNDSKLYAWGNNYHGQLGDGTTNSSNLPEVINLPDGATPVAISAGEADSLAIGSNGKLYGWGDNQFGELGNGSTTDSLTPTLVSLPAGLAPSVITSGTYHNLLITIPFSQPFVVTSPTDDGTGTVYGTLSYALSEPITGTTNPVTITFALTQGNTITLTGSLTTTAKVKANVTIKGGEFGTSTRIILNGNGISGDGLHLIGRDYLVNITIEHFGGKELVLEGTGNRLQGVVVIAS